MISDKELIAVVSILWTTTSFAIYIRSVLHRKTKPHMFSWVIWGLLNSVAAAAQLAGDAGAGAWGTAYCGLMCLTVFGLAIKFGEKQVTRSDWVMLIAALFAIPLWVLTDNPLAAVLLLSFINGAGYVPTLCKSYRNPYEENIPAFAMGIGTGVFLLASIEHYSWTTAMFPTTIFLGNFLLVSLLVTRRWTMNKAAPS